MTADTTSELTTRPTLADRAKVRGLISMRKMHSKVIERQSVRSYRVRRMPQTVTPALLPAAQKHKGMGWVPLEMTVPAEIPVEAKLPQVGYFLPYYGSSKLAWDALRRMPLNDSVAWTPALSWNRVFPNAEREWTTRHPADRFVDLRLQGPNPFLLNRIDDDTEGRAVFELDFGPSFEGVVDQVVAHFTVVDGALTATSITIHHPSGAETVTPADEDRWADARRVVDGLDSRWSTFVRHLLDVHLIVGQAYALSAFWLPVWHKLRPMLDFFTYGTIAVNDAAYRSLVSPSSYFVQSNFVKVDDAATLMKNAFSTFRFNSWLPTRDIEDRGLEAIPNHPWVHDAQLAWPALERVIRHFLAAVGLDTDAKIAADRDLHVWHAKIVELLPDGCGTPDLGGVEDLVDLLGVMLWNNVIHEVCGNLAPLLDTEDPDDKLIVNIDHLRALMDGTGPRPTALAGEVFLIEQAAYTSRFNVGGNSMLRVNGDRYTDDPKLQRCILELQRELQEIDEQLSAANSDRPIKFTGMMPRRWEASISF